MHIITAYPVHLFSNLILELSYKMINICLLYKWNVKNKIWVMEKLTYLVCNVNLENLSINSGCHTMMDYKLFKNSILGIINSII